MPVPADLERYASDNDSRFMEELFDFLRIPSVSARSEHNADTARAAQWTADSMKAIGLEASIHPTAG
jgi:acetylornithine deacetylase/succinyl-diaminopimelate desuccinylase-like protein